MSILQSIADFMPINVNSLLNETTKRFVYRILNRMKKLSKRLKRTFDSINICLKLTINSRLIKQTFDSINYPPPPRSPKCK